MPACGMNRSLKFVAIHLVFVLIKLCSCSCEEEIEFIELESLEDQIIKDVLSQTNSTNIVAIKDENNVYEFYSNKTSADKHAEGCKNDNSLLKYKNTTHTCYILGDDTSYMIDQIMRMTANSTNITSELLFKKLKFDNEKNLLLVDVDENNKTEFRFLANFHQLNQNEINNRRKNPRRRYMDEFDDKELSKKERKRRKKRNKKLKKKLKKRKNEGFFDKLKSTVKWVACVEITVAVCGCCLTVVQSVVLSYFCPVPLGTRIQPMNTMYARGFENYGAYEGFNTPFFNRNYGNNVFMNNDNNGFSTLDLLNYNNLVLNRLGGNMRGFNRN